MGQQDSVREDIDSVLGLLATWLLCYCAITYFNQVAAGWKPCFGVAEGPRDDSDCLLAVKDCMKLLSFV